MTPSFDSSVREVVSRLRLSFPLLLATALTAGATPSYQPPGTLDNSFQASAETTSPYYTAVYAVAVQRDGKVLIGGYFTAVNGIARNGFARLNPDGTLDSSFGSGVFQANYTVIRSIAVQADDKILVGGHFSTNFGSSHQRIVRLTANGTPDDGFRAGIDGDSPDFGVHAVAVQRDGKILIGGYFQRVNGVQRLHLARLHADGTLDTGFLNGLSGPSAGDHGVGSIAVQSDGKILVGGDFNAFNGESKSHLARLNPDGTLESGFFTHHLASRRGPFGMHAITVQRDGRILIGGGFLNIDDDSVYRPGIARVNADGTLDAGFGNPLSDRSVSEVYSIVVQNDGKILIGGSFPGSLVRLNADGTLDGSFLNGLSGPFYGIHSLAWHNDGKLLIGGAFTNVNGVPRNRIARLWAEHRSSIQSLTRPDGGDAILTLRLPPGTTNRVQYKSNLTDTAWIDLPGDVVASGSGLTNKVDMTVGTAQHRFYRLMLLP